MFLRNFVKKGLLDAVGKMADYQIILNAMGWFEKGVLLEEDLEEINRAIEESHKEPEPVEIEEMDTEPVEEVVEDTEPETEPEYVDLESSDYSE